MKLNKLLAIVSILLIQMVSYGASTSVPVFAAYVAKQDIVDEIEALGTLKANEFVNLTATVTELITKINFDDGQVVKKGDVIVEMDISEERAFLAEEQYRLEQAKRQMKRTEKLIRPGAATEATLDAERLEYQRALSRIHAIESQIEQRKIIAPFSGVLGQRNISVGALVQPGTLIATLDDDSVMKLDFSVPEIFLSRLKRGVAIKARTSAWPNEIFTGEIFSVNHRVDPVTRSISVRALIKNPEHKLRPGLLMRVNLLKDPRQALVIPEEALIMKANEKAVMLVETVNKVALVKRVIVRVGSRQQGNVEIIDGLQEGNLVVTHGTLRIRSGMRVKINAIDQKEPLHQLLEASSHKEHAT